MTDTTTRTPVGVVTLQAVRDLFEAKQAADGWALVSLDDLRALAGQAQKAVLDDLEGQLIDAQCHRCGRGLLASETYTRYDGTTYCLDDCEEPR